MIAYYLLNGHLCSASVSDLLTPALTRTLLYYTVCIFLFNLLLRQIWRPPLILIGSCAEQSKSRVLICGIEFEAIGVVC